jgi:hypothetical protein
MHIQNLYKKVDLDRPLKLTAKAINSEGFSEIPMRLSVRCKTVEITIKKPKLKYSVSYSISKTVDKQDQPKDYLESP